MRNDFVIPDLTFPSIQYGKRENPLDLAILLFSGGARVNSRLVQSMIDRRELGLPVHDRLELVQGLHAEINGRLVGGGSRWSAHTSIRFLRYFFTWAEENNRPLTFDSIQQTYLAWADALVQRVRVVKDISQRSAYESASCVDSLLSLILERRIPLIQLTRLEMPRKRKTARGVQAEKQNLQQTFAFGHMLQDICDGLTLEVVLNGALPVPIQFRTGDVVLQWSLTSRNWTEQALLTHQAEGTLRTRYPLANLRVEAELMMFIGQTGMNLAQATSLRLRHFAYVPHLMGYQVKERKYRRGGEVLFEIFKDYRPHLDRYLAWRRELFPDEDLLFPFVRPFGGAEDGRFQGQRIRAVCKELGISYVPAQSLRNTRVNWLLRRSADPDLTAEMSQHMKETLLSVYERPSQQRAIGEVMRFWAQSDPNLNRTTPIAPGECNGRPQPMSEKPKEAPQPDCIRPSGCLWCEHHRDIDTEDYVWSLASFGHLKLIELSGPNGARRQIEKTHPAQYAIDRITEKLRWFHRSNERRRAWVKEAQLRIEEGSYHPSWKEIIEGMEVAA
jgi:hypothetical protein